MTENNETIVDSRVYEISFIFDNKLDEETALKKGDALKQSIATLGGSFISEETPYLRELAYEMIRVQKNINVRFNTGYFGWIKFEIDADKIEELEKGLKLDEEVVRFLTVKTVRENTVYTKRAPVIKSETLEDLTDEEVNEGEVEGNIDESLLPEVAEEILPEEASEIHPEVVEEGTSEEKE